MSDIPSDSAINQLEQPSEDVSKTSESLPVTTGDSDKTLVLRKVSKSLRSLVDQQNPSCKSIKVSGRWECIICHYNNHSVAYTSPENADKLRHHEEYPFDTTILRSDFEKAAVDDLTSTLRNPKLQLKSYSIDSQRGFDYKYKNMKDVLKSINHQLSVRACDIDFSTLSHALSILPYLKPDVLEMIKVLEYFDENWNEREMKEVSRLVQWKQAQELELGFAILFEEFPMKYATHFKRFHLAECFTSHQQLVEIRNWLSKQNNFEYCLIHAYEPFVNSKDPREFRAVVGESAPPNERTEYVNHYSIPDSNDYLEFLFFEETIEIQKKKKK